MSFWGVEVKPGKPYTLNHEPEKGRLRITQATLGIDSKASLERSVVQCNVGTRSSVLLCSLLPDKTESCPLDLEYQEEDEIVFSVIGPRSVHLTGYYYHEYADGGGDDDEMDSYGEDIEESETEESDSEDGYEDDFIDDGFMDMFPSSPKAKSGVIIEEISDDEKHPSKKLKAIDHKRENVGSEQHIAAKKNLTEISESEDEDGFPIFLSNKNKSKAKNAGETKETAGVKDKQERKTTQQSMDSSMKVDNLSTKKSGKKKQQLQDAASNGDLSKVTTKELTTCQKPQAQNVDQKLADKQEVNENRQSGQSGKKRKKNVKSGITAEAVSVTAEQETIGKNDTDQTKGNSVETNSVTGSEKEESKSPKNELASKNKKKKKKSKSSPNGQDINKISDKNKADGEKDTAKMVAENGFEVQPSQTRTYSNGLVIEELAMGKPDGKRASPGKKVSVVYIGKLQNGAIFDSNIGKRPFQFRLGVGQVIKGWDVGVKGMRIGDKRRLTIPPSMGYGSSRAGKIPPNSWLIFDVELVGAQ